MTTIPVPLDGYLHMKRTLRDASPRLTESQVTAAAVVLCVARSYARDFKLEFRIGDVTYQSASIPDAG
jgi:hypothetical protein